MAGIRSVAKSALQAAALAGASSIALMGAANAQEFAQATDVTGVTVEGQVAAPASPKYTAPLLDTPQTITIVDHELIEQQSLLNLRDVLSTLPGITFGAGEGGGGYGDSINLRGFSANSDITVDGVRDSAQYSRTDPFYIEQIELMSGANSVYSGSGSVGGTINIVSKTPTMRNSSVVTGALGSDAYGRVTADVNRVIDGDIGFRLNAMIHSNDAPGRDVEDYHRFGLFPSITFGLGGRTQLTFSYLHQEDENTPQYGVPYALNAYNNGPFPGVSTEDYFGYSNIDTQEITVDQFTATLDHRFNEKTSLRSLLRYQEVSQYSLTSAVQGTFCLASGINPYSGAACAPTNSYAPSGPRGNVRDSLNTILYSQTDLRLDFDTGPLSHAVVLGLSLMHEDYGLSNGNVLRNPFAATPTPAVPTLVLSNPNSVWTGPVNFVQGGGVLSSGLAASGALEGQRDNYALYAFDTIELSPHWEINGGVRVERNEGENRTGYFTAYGYLPGGTVNGNELGAASPGAPGGALNGWSPWFSNEDTLVSYRLGLVYKPIDSASLYFVYGNSETPSQTTVSGACTAATCNVDPEEAVTYELGAKWDAFGGRLQLTGAIFRNERTNFRVASGDPSVPEQQLDGSSRVDGVALGMAGLITDHWSIFANYTYLDSEIEQSISDFLIGGGTVDFQAGDPLPTTPENSFSFWTTYETSGGFTIGYGATYQGEYTFNRASSTSALYYTEPYWVHRAMIAYEVTDHFVLQLNVNNLFDETYYTRIRNNATSGWATPGDARNFVLSANLRY